MTHELPQLLPECEVSRQHFCPSCRDRDKGRGFRQSILQIRGIEGVDVDFECPRGKPWKSRGLGDTIAPTSDTDIRKAIERAEVCETCEHAKKVTLTKNTRPVYGVKCGKCGCGNLSLINGRCPEGKWSDA